MKKLKEGSKKEKMRDKKKGVKEMVPESKEYKMKRGMKKAIKGIFGKKYGK